MRSYWKSVKTINTIRFPRNDKRPYAEVKLLNRIITGLLDTGAAISVVGGNFAKQIIQRKHPFNPIPTEACTADGKRQEVVGRFRTPVRYKGVVEDLDLIIIPSLSQDVYLGIDFWSKFGLLRKLGKLRQFHTSHRTSRVRFWKK